MPQGVQLSAEQIEAVAESLLVSPSWRAAADHAGINERTVHRYRERHEAYANRHQTDDGLPNLPDETDPDYLAWSVVNGWVEARSNLEMNLVRGVLAAIPKDWKAAHAMLKSGWPQDYSDRVELTGAGGGPIQVSAAELDARAEEAFARAQAKLEAATGSGESAKPAPRGD